MVVVGSPDLRPNPGQVAAKVARIRGFSQGKADSPGGAMCTTVWGESPQSLVRFAPVGPEGRPRSRERQRGAAGWEKFFSAEFPVDQPLFAVVAA
jgi:hypothetical protein